jgi:tetratricopeptide (TPR) repeat protein
VHRAPTSGAGSSDRRVVGREREIAVLEGAFADAVAGRGRLLLLIGDPGIGKTRLAREITARAAAAGGLALWGRCWEAGGAPEYWPWVQMLRRLAADDPEGLGAEPAERIERLSRILPELRAAGAEPTAAPAPDGEPGRFRLFEAASLLFGRVATRRPLVLVVDDLHAADLSSILLLHFLARELRDARVLLVGTFREAEARLDPARARPLADLRRDGETLALRALEEREIARLVSQEVGAAPPDALVREVYRLSEGNPLLAGEALRLLRTRPAGDLKVPAHLGDLMRGRLDTLSDDCAELLTVAAVVGREFDVSDLRHATTLTPARVLDVLGEAEASGVIRASGREGSLYGFSHGLLRDALYGRVPLGRRAFLHGRVGASLEERYGADPGARLAELAHHFAEAAQAGGDAVKAVDYARRAGDQARTLFAFAEAASHYERALGLSDVDPRGTELRCDLLLGLGQARTLAGDTRRAREAFLQAVDLARRLGDVERFARAAIGAGGHALDLRTRSDRQAEALVEEALGHLGAAESPHRVRLLARQTRALYYTGSRARVVAAADEALALARRLGDPALLAMALDARHFALWGPGPTAEKLAVADEILACGRAARSSEIEAAGHFWRFVDLLEAGDLLAATSSLGAYEELAAELRQPFFAWRAATHRAALALLQGRFADAERLVQRAVEIGEPLSSRNPALIGGVQLYILRREQAPADELEPVLRAMAEENSAMPAFRAALPHLLSELGHADEARAAFESVAGAGFETFPRDSNWLSMMGELAGTAAFLGDEARAATLYELLLPFADQVIVTAFGDLCEGSVARHLGVLATTLRRFEAAARHFERALELDGRLGARPFLARTKYELARMLLARAADGDRVRADGVLAEAGAAAAAIGMTTLRARVDALRAALAAPAPAPGTLFRLDGAIWTVAYAGRTVHLKDAKGMRYLAQLLRHPGVERHALEFHATVAGNSPAGGARPSVAQLAEAGLAVRHLGDAGEVLDERAKREYQRRMTELREELADAEACRDLGRAERTRAEIETIEQGLAQAFGLGGRSTRAASAAERARISATKAIRQTIDRIAEEHPALAEHLGAAVRTGRFFCYAPDPPVAWVT